MRLIAFDISEERDVIPPSRVGFRQMTAQIARQRVVPSELGAIFRIGIEREPVFAEQGLLLGQSMRFLIFGAQRPRLLLAQLDVGLVEGIDAQHRAGDGGRDLEAEKLLAQVPGVPHDDARDGMSRPRQRPDELVLARIFAPFELDIDEEAVAAVALNGPKRLVDDGDQPFFLLARAFREELLQPGRKRRRPAMR